MRTINGGLRATLAAIRQENEDNRLEKEERARLRNEIRESNRKEADNNRREREARDRKFGEPEVKFCGCGFSRAFRTRRNHGV